MSPFHHPGGLFFAERAAFCCRVAASACRFTWDAAEDRAAVAGEREAQDRGRALSGGGQVGGGLRVGLLLFLQVLHLDPERCRDGGEEPNS